MAVIHATGGPTCEPDRQRIRVPAGKLDGSARTLAAHPRLGIHCMIDRDGAVRSSVPQSKVAPPVLTDSRRTIPSG